jgi:hypothetical protein
MLSIFIDTNCSDMTEIEKEDFRKYAAEQLDGQFPFSEDYAYSLKESYTNKNLLVENSNYKNSYEYTIEHEDNLIKESIYFSDASEAMEFILKQPAMAAYGGYDIKKMSDEEIVEFANELLHQFEMVSHKYKK